MATLVGPSIAADVWKGLKDQCSAERPASRAPSNGPLTRWRRPLSRWLDAVRHAAGFSTDESNWNNN